MTSGLITGIYYFKFLEKIGRFNINHYFITKWLVTCFGRVKYILKLVLDIP